MAAEWYCFISGQVHGPFDSPTVKEMAARGQLKPSDQIRNGMEGEWIPADKSRGLVFASVMAPAPLNLDESDEASRSERPRRRQSKSDLPKKASTDWRRGTSAIRGLMWAVLAIYTWTCVEAYYRAEKRAETVFQVTQAAATNCLLVIAGYVICRAIDEGLLRDYSRPTEKH